MTPVRAGFWLQYTAQGGATLCDFSDELAQSAPGRPGMSFGPVSVPGTLNPQFERMRARGDAIIDPHGYLLDREATKRAEKHFPWLVQTRPAAQQQWESWMEDALDHQLDAAVHGSSPPPSFVITASPVVDASRGNPELDAVIDAAAAVRARQPPGADCWLGVTVDRAYVRDQLPLSRLANAMLATGADGFVFRAQHTWLPPVVDRSYLSGLRDVVEACAANNIRIYLPHSGWLGWLAMGWGAWGFSGGLAAGSWADRIPTPMTAPSQPAEPYFEPQLLRSVPWRVHQQLLGEPGYQPCACPDCAQMGTSHDLALAQRHQIRHALQESANLTAVPGAQCRQLVRNRIAGSIVFRDGLSQATRGRIGTDHLDRWYALL